MASPQTSGNGQIQPRNQNKQPPTLVQMLGQMTPEIARALPRHVNPDRMARIALTALRTTPKLAQCTPESFLGCIIQAAQLGLEVNTPLGHAYLIPFEDRRNNRVLCQLIIGYQGMIDLARRSGFVKAVYAFAVYKGDEFSWTLGLEPSIKHTPGDTDKTDKDLTHVYAVAKLEGGEPIFTVLKRSDVERYRKRSKASGSGPWTTDYEAMALKTAIRRLYRWLPKSVEMAHAAALDEAPELGKSQLGSASEEVLNLLTGQGLDVATEIAASGTDADDAEEGDLTNHDAQDDAPEPGSNG
jgi:recombination protein RecT